MVSSLTCGYLKLFFYMQIHSKNPNNIQGKDTEQIWARKYYSPHNNPAIWLEGGKVRKKGEDFEVIIKLFALLMCISLSRLAANIEYHDFCIKTHYSCLIYSFIVLWGCAVLFFSILLSTIKEPIFQTYASKHW